jgi:hypothetical protein
VPGGTADEVNGHAEVEAASTPGVWETISFAKGEPDEVRHVTAPFVVEDVLGQPLDS